MATLILSPRYTPDSAALWQVALDNGWSVERLQSHRPPLWLRDNQPVIYGEAIFANIIAEELSLALLEPPFDWLVKLPFKYRQREIAYMTLEAAQEQSKPIFVKPAYDKSFDAKVYTSGRDLPAGEALPEDMPVLVAEPVSWETEFRCFILERKVTAFSVYSRAGELTQAEDESWPMTEAEQRAVTDFCETLLADASLNMPPAFVIDVGEIADRGWAVVEANPAWASGIYGCNPAHVLSVLERACVRQERLSTDDAQWIFERLV